MSTSDELIVKALQHLRDEYIDDAMDDPTVNRADEVTELTELILQFVNQEDTPSYDTRHLDVPAEFDPLAQLHAKNNPGHQVIVKYVGPDDLTEKCLTCDWWNGQ